MNIFIQCGRLAIGKTGDPSTSLKPRPHFQPHLRQNQPNNPLVDGLIGTRWRFRCVCCSGQQDAQWFLCQRTLLCALRHRPFVAAAQELWRFDNPRWKFQTRAVGVVLMCWVDFIQMSRRLQMLNTIFVLSAYWVFFNGEICNAAIFLWLFFCVWIFFW